MDTHPHVPTPSSSSHLHRTINPTSSTHSHTSSDGSVASFASSANSKRSNNPFPPQSDSRPDHTLHDNSSAWSSHTLRTIRNGAGSDEEDDDEQGHRTIHIRTNSDDDSSAGTAGDAFGGVDEQAKLNRRRTIVHALAKLAILFVVCASVAGGTLYFALPEIDDEDRANFRIPKNFDQLKALNVLLQRYKEEHFGRVMISWIIVYTFLQAFSIPGSMYMSILAGAMWGVPLALPIVCATVATGATICYLISKFLGQVLTVIPSWKARVDGWKDVLDRQRGDMLSYLIVIRMMPLPPHNIVNILAPHLGIKIPLFWISTFFGIFAVSVIHTTIGEKLDQMTSPADFHLITFRNALLLGGVCVAVMIPVILKKRSPAALDPLEEGEVTPGAGGSVRLEGEEGPLGGPHSGRRSLMGRSRLGRYGEDDDDDDDELPPVRMRGAITGLPYDRRNGVTTTAEQREAQLEDDADSDGRPASRGSMDGTDTDEESLRGFDDRREQSTAGGRSSRLAKGAYTHPRSASDRNSGAAAGRVKAGRVLGLAGPATFNPRSQTLSHSNGAAGGPSITDSLTGLWTKVTGR